MVKLMVELRITKMASLPLSTSIHEALNCGWWILMVLYDALFLWQIAAVAVVVVAVWFSLVESCHAGSKEHQILNALDSTGLVAGTTSCDYVWEIRSYMLLLNPQWLSTSNSFCFRFHGVLPVHQLIVS